MAIFCITYPLAIRHGNGKHLPFIDDFSMPSKHSLVDDLSIFCPSSLMILPLQHTHTQFSQHGKKYSNIHQNSVCSWENYRTTWGKNPPAMWPRLRQPGKNWHSWGSNVGSFRSSCGISRRWAAAWWRLEVGGYIGPPLKKVVAGTIAIQKCRFWLDFAGWTTNFDRFGGARRGFLEMTPESS